MTPDDDLIGLALAGRYHLQRLLGEGGMARVFEAADLHTGERVAIKLLHRQYRTQSKVFARFQREAEIVGSIRHDNVAGLVRADTVAGKLPYIVMELLAGSSLRETLQGSAPFTAERAARISLQVLAGLEAAHAAGVVHRDLKPGNIFLVADREGQEQVKLIDFGVSKLVSPDDSKSPITDSGAVVGTAAYTSPEQAMGAKHVTARSDIYSMGVILYEMVTGSRPFEASNKNALLLKILIETPRDPQELNSSVPKEMTEVIAVAMARDPGKRFADCAAFRDRLLPFLRDEATHASAKLRSIPQQPTPVADSDVYSKAEPIGEVIFVRLGSSSSEIALENGRSARILPVEDEKDLVGVLSDCSPCGIVSGVDLDVARLTADVSGFRETVIVIDLQSTRQELSIYEWAPSEEGYVLRRAAITELDAEVNALVRRGCLAPRSEDVGSLGFDDRITVGTSVFQVVTEVVSRKQIKITTRVFFGGQIVDSIVQRTDGETANSTVRTLASDQHLGTVERTLRGKYVGDHG